MVVDAEVAASRRQDAPAGILALLAPREVAASAYDIDPEALARRAIRGVIVDLDNTLVAWGETRPDPRLKGWLEALARHGLRACIASNALEGRARAFAQAAGVPVIPKAGKPRARAFLRAMEVLGTAPETTAVVGDQLFTDILGGNRLGCWTILVAPVNPREFPGTRLTRLLEGGTKRLLRRLGRWP